MKKTLAILGSVLLLSTGAAFAQSVNQSPTTSANEEVTHDVTGFSSKWSGPGLTKEQINRSPNPNVVLKPKLGGAAVAVAKYGPVMIAPTAPASYGIGAQYLSAPDALYDLPHESGFAAHRDAGGIKVFSIEF